MKKCLNPLRIILLCSLLIPLYTNPNTFTIEFIKPTEVLKSDDITKSDTSKTDYGMKEYHINALNLQDSIGNVDTTRKFKEFLDVISFRESTNNWKCVNTLGYIGKYQFGKIALKDVGYTVNVDSFKVHPEIFDEGIQDKCMKKLLKNNSRYLKSYIKQYSDKYINGLYITKSSILGAAHLVGNAKVKKYLKCNGNIDIHDSYGTNIEEYLVLLSNYKIKI